MTCNKGVRAACILPSSQVELIGVILSLKGELWRMRGSWGGGRGRSFPSFQHHDANGFLRRKEPLRGSPQLMDGASWCQS